MDSLTYGQCNEFNTRSRKIIQANKTLYETLHTELKDRLTLIENGEQTSKEETTMARPIKWYCEDKKDSRKVRFISKTGLKGTFEKTEVQDEEQTKGSICL